MKRFLKRINLLLTHFEEKILKPWLKKNKFVLFLMAIILILRIPSLFEPYWYGDEGIYLSIGLAIRKGFLLYRDVFDNKPPMIYLIAAAANGTIFWFRFFLLVSTLSATYFFYRVSQLIFGGKENSARLSAVAFSLLSTIRLFEGNVANSEIFILLPTTLGFFLIFKYFDKLKPGRNLIIPLVSGVILSIGFLLKVPALFDLLAISFFLVFLNDKKKFISFGKKEILLFVGYFVPILLTSLFFLFKGVFSEYFNSAFVQTVGYLSSWKTGTHAFSLMNLLKSELVFKGILVMIICALLWVRKKYLNMPLLFISIWFTLSLYGATLSGRPYGHYLIQVVPSFALFSGFLIFKKSKAERLIPIGFLILFAFSFFYYRFWTYTTVSYYQNFIEFSLGQKDKNSYLKYFNQDLPELYEIGEQIEVYSKPSDKIFIWANEPSLYAMTKRLPATPYLAAYHIIDLNLFQKTYTDLKTQIPKLIIVDGSRKKFPELETLVKALYVRVESVGDFNIYSKRTI